MTKQLATSRRGTPTKKTRQKPESAGRRPRPGRSWASQGGVRIAGTLLVGLLVGMLFTSGLKRVTAESPGKGRRWQYSRFTFALDSVSWSTPDRHYVAEDLDDLHRYIAKSDPQGQITPVGIANLIGNRGWELVNVSYSRDPRGYDYYWFRRSID